MGRRLRILPLAFAALCAVAAACAREEATTPAEVTAKFRAFAAEQCGGAAPGGYEPGYLRVVDVSKDSRPDYAVDFAALRCGGERAVLCGDSGCPREIWVSDGRTGYTLAFAMSARAFALDEAATPPTVSVTLVGEACPAPAAPPPAPASAAGSAAADAPPRQEAPVCRKTYVFDPIRLVFQDADKVGAEAVTADPPPGTPSTP